MTILFQADADLNHNILLGLARREPGLDFQSAIRAGLAGLDDLAVLELCAESGRLLVTHDARTMPRHFATMVQRQASPGLVIVPQKLPIALAIDDLLTIWSVTTAEEWRNRICYLPL